MHLLLEPPPFAGHSPDFHVPSCPNVALCGVATAAVLPSRIGSRSHPRQRKRSKFSRSPALTSSPLPVRKHRSAGRYSAWPEWYANSVGAALPDCRRFAEGKGSDGG